MLYLLSLVFASYRNINISQISSVENEETKKQFYTEVIKKDFAVVFVKFCTYFGMFWGT